MTQTETNAQVQPQQRLRDRAISAGAWTLGSYGTDLSVRLFSNLILTRLLSPEAFGAIAAAMALIAGLVLISDFGVRTAIIQSPRADQIGFLRSAWMFQLSHGSAVWIVLVCLCLFMKTSSIWGFIPAGSVFADPNLPLVAPVLGLTVILSGAESTSLSLNVRSLNYKPLVFLNFAGRIASLPIMLTWAWIAPSVWAIVGGILGASLVRLLLSHIWVPGPRMGLNWDRAHFREIAHFGKWMVISSGATFVSQQCDVILIGILAPASTLGVYAIAKLLAATGEGLLDQLNSALALPIFGEVMRKDPASLRNRYYRFRLPIEVAAGVLSGVVFVAGDFIVHFLYDPRYLQAGTMLQILALGTLSYPFSIIGTAFTAVGDTHIAALASTLKGASLVGFITGGYFAFGISGAIVGIALHRLVPSIAIIGLAHRRNWILISRELRIIPAFLGGLALGKAILFTTTALGMHNIRQIIDFMHFYVAK